MPELCFATNLTSQEWAAWVQAIGSILAILAAVGVAWWQHRSTTRQLQQERRARTWRQRSVARMRLNQLNSLVEKLATTTYSFFPEGEIDRTVFLIRKAEIPLSSDEIGELSGAEIEAIMEAEAALDEIVALIESSTRDVEWKSLFLSSKSRAKFSVAVDVIDGALHSSPSAG